MKKRIIHAALRMFLWQIALLWCKTLKIKFFNGVQFEELRKSNKNHVVAFWHGSMLVGWYLHRPENNQTVSALVSHSADGEYLSAILEKWNYKMIRGSSHIGGKEAMQLMVDEVMTGHSLVITPDGPRGPRHEMKMGAIRTAQKTAVPLVLVAIAMNKKKVLRSWDKFEVPIPFSRVAVKYSELIYVSRELDGDSLNKFKITMQEKLCALNEEVEQFVNASGDEL